MVKKAVCGFFTLLKVSNNNRNTKTDSQKIYTLPCDFNYIIPRIFIIQKSSFLSLNIFI